MKPLYGLLLFATFPIAMIATLTVPGWWFAAVPVVYVAAMDI